MRCAWHVMVFTFLPFTWQARKTMPVKYMQNGQARHGEFVKDNCYFAGVGENWMYDTFEESCIRHWKLRPYRWQDADMDPDAEQITSIRWMPVLQDGSLVVGSGKPQGSFHGRTTAGSFRCVFASALSCSVI